MKTPQILLAFAAVLSFCCNSPDSHSAAIQAIQPSGSAQRNDASSAHIRDLIGSARFKAAAWKKDAILVEVKVENPTNDGTINVNAGGTFRCIFLSPSSGQGFVVYAIRPEWNRGELLTTSPSPTPSSPYWIPIPHQMLDYTEVLSHARKEGFDGPITDAVLNGWEKGGKPYRCSWILTRRTDDIDHSTYCFDILTNKSFQITDVMDDAKKEFNDQYARFQQILQRWRDEIAARSVQQGHEEWSSTNWFSSHSGWSSYSSNNPSSGNDFNRQNEQYNKEVALQNAWENNDMGAYNRMQGGTASDSDKSNYGSGW